MVWGVVQSLGIGHIGTVDAWAMVNAAIPTKMTAANGKSSRNAARVLPIKRFILLYAGNPNLWGGVAPIPASPIDKAI